MKIPNPAIVTQTAAQRLPAWALLGLCLVYAFAGLVNRDPWKNFDVASFGYMWQWAHGTAQPWQLDMAGLTPEISGPLAYMLGGTAISALGTWLSPDLAARLAFIFSLLLTLTASWYAMYLLALNPHAQPVVFAFGGEAKPADYAKAIADAGLLALIACLGLALPSHETTPIALQLFATSLLFLGGACIRTHILLATLIIDFSLWLLALSGAPTVALLLGIGLLLLVLKQQKCRLEHLILIVFGCAGVVAISTWADLWQWRLISWAELSVQWKGLLRLLLWFTWPAWPLAAWTLWTWRDQWRSHVWQQHLVLPVFMWSVIFIASVASKNPERTLLLSLPSLACLAAFALPTLNRSVSSLIDWFTLLFFTGGAVIIWVVWLSLQTGWPAQPAINVSRLIPGYLSVFEIGPTAVALVVTALWCKLVSWRLGRNPRFIWKSLVLPASGATLCWVLLMTLWMPMLNYARSYQPLAMQVVSYVGHSSCVYSHGLNRSQLGGLSFHGRLNFQAFEKSSANNECTWLMTNPEFIAASQNALDVTVWKKIKVIRRPADKREDIAIYQRIGSSSHE